MSDLPVVAISVGDTNGIGTEIILKSFESKELFKNKSDCILDNSKIETLIDKLVESDKIYPVVCSDTGELLGEICLLYTSPSPRDQRGSRMPACA